MPEETAEAVRKAAEARRQKILKAADDRMSIVVEGKSKEQRQQGGEEDGADGDGAPAAAASSGTTPSASSRMAAMRRRRFKSKQQQTAKAKEGAEVPAAPATEEEDAKKEEVTAAAPGTKDSTDEAKGGDEGKQDATSPPPPIVSEEAPKVTEEKPKTVEETSAAAAEASADTTGTATEEPPKRKYQGVAKMRRRMIKEKQKLREASEQEASTEAAATTTAAAIDAKKVLERVHRKPALLPILMHVVTVLLLFLAGLDVGLQQSSIDYYGGALLTVHTDLAPRSPHQLGGLAAIVRGWTGGGPGAAAKDRETLVGGEEWQEEASLLEHDEFADVGVEGGDSDSDASNLDPLFRVDLDKLMQGPGLTLWLGRGAVRVHRLNLAIFWYGPRGFFLGFADWLFSLTTSPPVLCLVAIIIRQLVGKVVLGAHLPAKVEDETQHKDVMSMIKQFVSNFILKSFPTMTSLYDVWTHVRADMYVLLCGVFVGMAYSHTAGTGLFGETPSTSGMAFEEAVPPIPEAGEQTPPTITEGVSDEL